jgi:hypothetical protein
MSVEANPLMTRLDGPSPAMQVGKDIARRALYWLPGIVALCAIGWGANGAASAAYGVAIVTVNFLLAAWLLSVTGRISFAMMAGAALFGFLIRLGLIFLAVMLVKDASWVALVPLGLTLIVTHLGLLFWEMRYVSASLAFPGLKPQHAKDATSTQSVQDPAAEAA